MSDVPGESSLRWYEQIELSPADEALTDLIYGGIRRALGSDYVATIQVSGDAIRSHNRDIALPGGYLARVALLQVPNNDDEGDSRDPDMHIVVAAESYKLDADTARNLDQNEDDIDFDAKFPDNLSIHFIDRSPPHAVAPTYYDADEPGYHTLDIRNGTLLGGKEQYMTDSWKHFKLADEAGDPDESRALSVPTAVYDFDFVTPISYPTLTPRWFGIGQYITVADSLNTAEADMAGYEKLREICETNPHFTWLTDDEQIVRNSMPFINDVAFNPGIRTIIGARVAQSNPGNSSR